jgi:hypothetical protein
MKKNEIVKNISLVTIPVCLVLFVLGWLVFRNIWGAAVIPVILFAASLRSNIGRYFDDIKRDEAGVTKRKFKAVRAFDLLAPNDSVGPSLCLDIGDDKYLLLNGQWLYEDEIYGEGVHKYYDGESDFFNCFVAPHSFPATEFELWISNLDDQPCRIIVSGDYLEPEEVTWPTPENYHTAQYAIIDKKEITTENPA